MPMVLKRPPMAWHLVISMSFLSILLCLLYSLQQGNKGSIGWSNRLILATGGSWPAAFCIFSSGPIHGRSVTDIGWHSHLLKAWGEWVREKSRAWLPQIAHLRCWRNTGAGSMILLTLGLYFPLLCYVSSLSFVDTVFPLPTGKTAHISSDLCLWLIDW